MADEALEPASANPFDLLAENDNISAAAPVAKTDANVFDQIGPDIAEQSSASGSFGRAAARATLPSIAAFPAMGAGAQAGAAIGAVAGPVGAVAGGLVGALAGGFGAGYVANAAQDWAISKLPDSWQEAIGQDERQRKMDEQQHGTAAFLGGLLPTVLTMKPGLPAKMGLRENATAFERIMAYPATAAVFGGGVMGGMELAQQAPGEQPINWTHVAVATGVGVVFNRTTRFGERLIESGARPTRRALGQPEPGEAVSGGAEGPEATVAPATPVPAAAPEVAPGFARFYHGGDEPGSGGARWLTPDAEYARNFRAEGQPNNVHYVDIPEDSPLLRKSFDDAGTDQKAPYVAFEAPEEVAKGLRPYQVEPEKPPGVTARDWNEAILGQKEAPTVLEASDAKVIGPGVTESVFMGTQDQSQAAAMSAQQAVRNERLAMGESPVADVHRSARSMEPEVFASYEDLQAKQEDLRRWIAEAEEQGGAPAAKAALARIDAELEAMSPQISAAYRRSAEARGTDMVDPIEGIGNVSRLSNGGDRETLLNLSDASGSTGAVLPGVSRGAHEGMAENAPDVAGAASESARPEVRGSIQEPGETGAAGVPVRQPEGGNAPSGLQPAAQGGMAVSAMPSGAALQEQRAFIAQDVAARLVAAGRPAEEASALGQIVAARYETRARRLEGALGSPKELYLREGPEIAGPDGKITQIPTGRERELAQVDWTPGGGAKTVQIGNTSVEYGVAKDGKSAEIVLVRTPKPERGKGSARAAMETITDVADVNGTTLFLNSEPMGGGVKKTKLDEFYKSLGFVKNIGKNKDFTSRAEFVRPPKEELFQRDQRQTPEFKRWFGESKIVDDAGQPMVMYRGNRAEIKEWKSEGTGQSGEMLGPGIYVTNSPEYADAFTGGSGNITPLYVKAENILENPHNTGLSGRALRNYAIKNGYDGIRGVVGDGTFQLVVFEPTQIKSATGNRGSFDPNSPKILEQTARGKVRIAEGRKPIITLMKDANPSTFLHESGHVYLEELMRDAMHERAPAMLRDDADTVLGWLGAKSAEDIKTKHHEKFARGFEQYLREGVAPSKELAGVFARFKDWLLQIYESLKGLGAPINEDIKGVFDRMLAMEPQRTVIAAEREPGGPTIHDIHETEAREISTPAEAAPKADQVAAEANRYAAELTPEVKNELEAKIAQLETELGALKGQPDAGAKPAGEAGAGAGETGPLEPGSGKPGALNASLDGGAQPGAVGERGGGAAAESARQPDVDTGNPLAPKPASLFGPEQSPFIDKAGNIRLDTLTNVEDVRTAIRDAAAANQDFIGDRRGVVTDGQVMDVARAAGMEGAERLVKNRIVGQAFSAEEVMTLRLALVQSATEVSASMKKAANGTDADVMAYAQAKDRHQLLQATVSQATAEAGRALRAFRDISGMTGEAQNADLFVRQATGKTLFQLRQEARLGATLDTPEAVSKFMADARKRTFGNMMLEYWINGLLSGPTTHVTNITGNLILTLQHMVPETAVAAGIGSIQRALGREGEVIRFGEIGARFKGLAQAFPSAVKAGAEAAYRGTGIRLPGEESRRLPFQTSDTSLQPVLDEGATVHSVIADAYGAVQGLQDAIISTGALIKAGGEAGSPLIGTQYSMTGAIPDITVRGVNVLPIGTAVRLPGRFLAAADGFFRALNYSMEKSARAYRMASEEGLTGTKFDARVADIRQNPTEAMMTEMAEESSKLTLMDRGGKFLTALERLSNVEIGGFPALKFVMPFVHVAGTIMRQAVMDRTPIGLLSAEIRADLMGKNGNVAQDMAMARMLFGTGLAVTMGTMAAQGQAAGSGPTDRNEAAMWRLAGNQAHSVRIGDMWYAVDRLGPTGMLMSIAADLYDVSKLAKEGEVEDATAKVMQAFSQNILDQSMMKGPSELLRAVNDSDRYGSQYVRNFLSAFVPYSVGMAQLAKSQDPYTVDARTAIDAIRAKIPGHLDSYFENPLFPKRDIWGEPLKGIQHLGPSGIAVTQLSTDPVNVAMLELGVSPAPVSRKIRNVELTDPQFDDFARMAGRMAKQRLDVIVKSPDWRTWPNYAKTLVVEETVKQSREVARGLMMGKYPSIAKDATETKLEKFRD